MHKQFVVSLYYFIGILGGVRRQFFSVVLEKIAMSDTLRVFEGPSTGRRPVFAPQTYLQVYLK